MPEIIDFKTKSKKVKEQDLTEDEKVEALRAFLDEACKFIIENKMFHVVIMAEPSSDDHDISFWNIELSPQDLLWYSEALREYAIHGDDEEDEDE